MITFSNDERFGLVDREILQLTGGEKFGRCHPLGRPFVAAVQY
jgi:hypothetical protein